MMVATLHSAAQAQVERQRAAFNRLTPAEKTEAVYQAARGGRS